MRWEHLWTVLKLRKHFKWCNLYLAIHGCYYKNVIKLNSDQIPLEAGEGLFLSTWNNSKTLGFLRFYIYFHRCLTFLYASRPLAIKSYCQAIWFMCHLLYKLIQSCIHTSTIYIEYLLRKLQGDKLSQYKWVSSKIIQHQNKLPQKYSEFTMIGCADMLNDHQKQCQRDFSITRACYQKSRYEEFPKHQML